MLLLFQQFQQLILLGILDAYYEDPNFEELSKRLFINYVLQFRPKFDPSVTHKSPFLPFSPQPYARVDPLLTALRNICYPLATFHTVTASQNSFLCNGIRWPLFSCLHHNSQFLLIIFVHWTQLSEYCKTRHFQLSMLQRLIIWDNQTQIIMGTDR